MSVSDQARFGIYSATCAWPTLQKSLHFISQFLQGALTKEEKLHQSSWLLTLLSLGTTLSLRNYPVSRKSYPAWSIPPGSLTQDTQVPQLMTLVVNHLTHLTSPVLFQFGFPGKEKELPTCSTAALPWGEAAASSVLWGLEEETVHWVTHVSAPPWGNSQEQIPGWYF